MSALSLIARERIKCWTENDRRLSIAGYIRHWMGCAKWSGDSCGCPDDRCKDGYHHDPHEECACLDVSIAVYVCTEIGHSDRRRMIEIQGTTVPTCARCGAIA